MSHHKAAWEPIIGLEVHVELNTRSKLFSIAPNRFGDEPNTNITEVCTGQPGALPVLNEEAVRKAVQFGCAIGAKVATFSKFDRKSYFYPDSPRNFQITQYEEPIAIGGTVIAEVDGQEKSFAVHRVHLEDDSGMLKHFSSFAAIDYNRAGVPLIEIVSEPCIYTPKEAVAYAMAIKAILEYIDVSDCNMEEGSLRFDANVSVRPQGESGFRNKIEIKNMNSFNFLEMALEAEIKRQISEYRAHPHIPHKEVIEQATYRWDPDNKQTVLMRKKEKADDYRYFPEPDLLPIVLTEAYIEEIRQSLPELPLQRERRYVQQLGLSPHNAFVLTSNKLLADYFEDVLSYSYQPRHAANWITVEFAGRFKESGKTLVNSAITPEHVAELIAMIEDKAITGPIAKAVADEMVAAPGTSPRQIVAANPDYRPMDSVDKLEVIIDQVLEEHSQSVAAFKAGKERAFIFLMGQVMQKTRGTASPHIAEELLKKKLGQE